MGWVGLLFEIYMKKLKFKWWIVEHENGIDALETEEPVTVDVARKEFEEKTGLKVEVIAMSSEEEVELFGLDVY